MVTGVGSVTFCVVGLKGYTFLKGMLEDGLPVHRIFSYRQPGDRAKAFEACAVLASSQSIPFIEGKAPVFEPADLVFVVGWQYLFKTPTPHMVVFHDSLLPRFRGFAPTVNALIQGETEIGVTALSPRRGADTGPVIGQASVSIQYPMTINEALTIQGTLMCKLGQRIASDWRQGIFRHQPQDESKATYSLWRDENDYQIDWNASAQEIRRFIDAVGHPYAGARTTLNGCALTIEVASEEGELRFEGGRHTGKVWTLDEGRPVVVCGRGLLRLDRIVDHEGKPCDFPKLRIRFR